MVNKKTIELFKMCSGGKSREEVDPVDDEMFRTHKEAIALCGAIPDLTADCAAFMTDSVLHRLSDIFEHTGALFTDMPASLRSLMETEKFRARIIACIFHSFMKNCEAVQLFNSDRNLENVLAAFGPCDEDAELVENRWLIPLSGVLSDDIKVNFVAKCAEKLSCSEAVEVILDLLALVFTQCICCVAGLYKTGVAKAPWFVLELAKWDTTEERVNELKNFFGFDRKAMNAQKISVRKILPANIHGLHGYMQDDYAFEALLFDCEQGALTNYRYVTQDQRLAPLSTSMIGASEPNKGCISILSLTDRESAPIELCKQVVSGEKDANDIKDKIFSLDNLDAAAITLLYQNSYLLNRERREYTEKRKQLLEGKKEKPDKSAASAIQISASAQKEIERLEAELKKANEKLEAANKTRKDLDSKMLSANQTIRYLEKKNQKLEEKLAEIEAADAETSEIIASAVIQEDEMAQQATEAAAVEEPLDVSVLDDVRIVCYGGHPAWYNAMKTLHPNVTIYHSDSSMNEKAIATADMVWFQCNSMSHEDFYKLCAKAKVLGKAVRYFSYAGHISCKKQLIEGVKEFLAQNANRISCG